MSSMIKLILVPSDRKPRRRNKNNNFLKKILQNQVKYELELFELLKFLYFTKKNNFTELFDDMKSAEV